MKPATPVWPAAAAATCWPACWPHCWRRGWRRLTRRSAPVWLHGAAADRCAARESQLTMLPHDILQDLGALLGEQGAVRKAGKKRR